MNPDDTMASFKQFLEQVQETQEELLSLKKEEWDKTVGEINQTLDIAGYSSDDPERTTLFQIMKIIWGKGYDRGIWNMAEYNARAMGMGEVVDKIKITENQLFQKPENN